MAHHAVMFFEIRLFVGRKINGLFPAEPIVRRQRFIKSPPTNTPSVLPSLRRRKTPLWFLPIKAIA